MPRPSVAAAKNRVVVGLLGGVLLVPVTVVAGPAPASAEPLNPCVSRDNGLPRVTGVSFAPSAVDVSDAPAQVTVSLAVVDSGGPGPASGVREVSVLLGDQEHDIRRLSLRHGAGDTWSATFTVPRYTSTSQWRVRDVSLVDNAGNDPVEEIFFTPGQPPIDGGLLVTSTPPSDTEPPVVTGLRLRPDAVDTTRRGKDVRVTVDANDESGIASLRVNLRKGRHLRGAFLQPTGSGSFTGTVRIPRWVGSGAFAVEVIQAVDGVGNVRTVRGSALAAFGDRFVEVVSRKDRAAPRVHSADLDPAPIDLRQRGRTVVVTARLSDQGSGVASAVAFIGVHRVQLERVRGSARVGTWRGTIRLRPCSSFVQRRHSLDLRVLDKVGNQLSAEPRDVIVRHRDLTPPRAALTSSAFDPDGPVTLRFNEPVNGINASSAPVQQWTGEAFVALAGTWRCRNGAGKTTSCTGGWVRVAAWTPAQPLDVPGSYAVRLNPEGNLDVTDMSGNPFRRVMIGGHTG